MRLIGNIVLTQTALFEALFYDMELPDNVMMKYPCLHLPTYAILVFIIQQIHTMPIFGQNDTIIHHLNIMNILWYTCT